MKVGNKERATQNRVIQLFQTQLGYRYLGNWHDRANNSNIEESLLTTYLETKGYSPTLINKAIYELKKLATDQSKSFYDNNKEVYRLLRYGVKVKESAADTTATVWLIDWDNPEANDFALAEEVTIKGENRKRPDIILYVNGIALGVMELKRSTVPVSEAIRQNLDNQTSNFIKPFFATVQFIMAGNDTEGLRYGTIETKEKYYLEWKEDSQQHLNNRLDRALVQICAKERFLELIHDFIAYDRGIKKICRFNQYFGIKKAQEFLQRRAGGIIWHTQGSGKSLTMVWLAKWIKENLPNSRILIITDREELDQQIENVFKGIEEDIYRTQNGQDLITQLRNPTPTLLCSLIHKFGKQKKEAADYDNYITDLNEYLSQNFQPQGDIYVFVDECHRTQSGKLHEAMRQILPNSVLIGFTGTPLLKQDKQKSIEIFGPYIHTYKFDEAVKDKVILDLHYEARRIDQDLTSPKKIDQWFEAKTQGLTEFAKTELKKRWGTMQKVLSSKDRLTQIVNDIILDMATKDRLQSGNGNALLVAGSIYEACKYYELFQDAGFTQCAIITSYKPTSQDIKGETSGEGFTEKLRQYETYNKMLNGKSPEAFEIEVKKKFIEEPEQMKLLIVVDKLLTGFDAPSATYLYIDKTMGDHGLFQAICRVNRLDGEDKTYGYIVDYKDLFRSLDKAISDYTCEAFEDYDAEDIKGLLNDRLDEAKENLDNALEIVKALCEPVKYPQDTAAHISYFCGNPEIPDDLKNTAPRRTLLYKSVAHLIRAYAQIANEMSNAGYTPAETTQIKAEVRHFENVRQEIKLASGDYIDLKMYESAMRHLIDTYIRAEESEKISAFDDLTLVQMIVDNGPDAVDRLLPNIRNNPAAVAATINNNLRTIITEEQPNNPKYYEQMSVLLDEIIELRRQEAINYEEYLKKIAELCQQVINPNESSHYPSSLDTNAKRTLYDNLAQNEELARQLDQSIRQTKKDGWRGNKIKEREVKYAISEHLLEESEVDRIFTIVRNQSDY